jgi:hypothetical protein
MSTVSVKRTRAVFGVAKKDIPKIILLAVAIYEKMTANAVLFPTPNPSLVILDTQTKDLTKAQQATLTRARGTASARDTKRDALWTTLELLCKYVQSLCDAAAEQAVFLIEASGFKVASSGRRQKEILAAKLGVEAGTVLLVANARALNKSKRQKTYHWQYTINGKDWINATSTPLARTTLTGLPALTSVGFRVAVADSKGTGEWSQTVCILVH